MNTNFRDETVCPENVEIMDEMGNHRDIPCYLVVISNQVNISYRDGITLYFLGYRIRVRPAFLKDHSLKDHEVV